MPSETFFRLPISKQERILAAYQEAVRLRYRFFSYGDACFIL